MPDLIRKSIHEPTLGRVLADCPVGLVLLEPGAEARLNPVAMEVLGEFLGSGQAGTSRWASAAAARLQSSGLNREIIKGHGQSDQSVEIRLNPLQDSGCFLLSVVPLVQETQSESLADTVSNLSHELRTPLTSMKSSLMMVHSEETGPLNQDQKHFLGMTLRNVDRLDRLVSDLLDVSRADAGQLSLRLQYLDLTPLISEIIASQQQVAESRGLTLKCSSAMTPLPGQFDGDKVVQMVTNLLGNALKFTPKGGKVALHLEKQNSEGRSAVQLEVRDNGPGMDYETLQLALKPFFRNKMADLEGIQGSGLGLHITQGLARAHGGFLGIDSRPGLGTRAWIRLPLDGQPLPGVENTGQIFDK